MTDLGQLTLHCLELPGPASSSSATRSSSYTATASSATAAPADAAGRGHGGGAGLAGVLAGAEGVADDGLGVQGEGIPQRVVAAGGRDEDAADLGLAVVAVEGVEGAAGEVRGRGGEDVGGAGDARGGGEGQRLRARVGGDEGEGVTDDGAAALALEDDRAADVGGGTHPGYKGEARYSVARPPQTWELQFSSIVLLNLVSEKKPFLKLPLSNT